MAKANSIRFNLNAHDVASVRIAEAIATILAMATSPGEGCGPAGELVSLSLDGVTALLEQAEDAVKSMSFKDLWQVA
ncbi:MAG: hypothetical protein HZB40_16740 [Rhodocyclales bacterium]|nr:hypothetical protein [Rhodocyclales bacterium]